MVFIRNNKIYGNHAYFPKTGEGADSSEMIEAFVAQFYLNRVPPNQVIISVDSPNSDILEALLSKKAEGRVQIFITKAW